MFFEKALIELPKFELLYYDRIGASEGINIDKTSALKACDICHYWSFLKIGFRFQPYLGNRCHDLLMMSMTLSDIPKGTDYCCILTEISKSERINLMQGIDVTEKNIIL